MKIPLVMTLAGFYFTMLLYFLVKTKRVPLRGKKGRIFAALPLFCFCLSRRDGTLGRKIPGYPIFCIQLRMHPPNGMQGVCRIILVLPSENPYRDLFLRQFEMHQPGIWRGDIGYSI